MHLNNDADDVDQQTVRVHKGLIARSLNNVRYICRHYENLQNQQQDIDEWQFVATVIDRCFLIIYAILNAFALMIILQAPTLYDVREPMPIAAAQRPVAHGYKMMTNT